MLRIQKQPGRRPAASVFMSYAGKKTKLEKEKAKLVILFVLGIEVNRMVKNDPISRSMVDRFP